MARQKSFLFIGVCILLLVFVTSTSCRVRTTYAIGTNKLPPGQAKKLTGSKSAKPFAPGQQKKKNY